MKAGAWVLRGMWGGLCQMSLHPSSLVVMHCWGWGATFHASGVLAFVAPGLFGSSGLAEGLVRIQGGTGL